MADTSRHLTYFKVENFKRFESFEMKDLGQFNLIVGDNNVGKTSVLEALLVDENEMVFVNGLAEALNFRRIKSSYVIEDIKLYANYASFNNRIFDYSIIYRWSNDIGHTELSVIINDRNRTIDIKRDGVLKVVPGNREQYNFSEPIQRYNLPFNFIPFYKGHDADLATFYSKLQLNRSLKKSFIKSLNSLIPKMEDIELSIPYPDSTPLLIVYQNEMDSAIPLALFGDGTIKLFRLLVEIILNKGGRLMIDEVDTGIYFKRFKEFWKAILLAAKENDVQLFMTTHNEECIKYFKEVLEEELPELQKDVRNITLVEHARTKVVTAHTFDYDQFEHAINVGNEIRG
jgi:AAA15 family ATPase/GTPase